MTVLITNEYEKIEIKNNVINKFIECCLKTLHLSGSEVSVLITDDQVIQELNHRYRQENKPTDVLSFGMREQQDLDDPMPPNPEVLGDLVVSLDRINKQAVDRNVSVEEELKFIIAHGLLHLIGFDHGKDIEKKRMDAQHAVLMKVCGGSK